MSTVKISQLSSSANVTSDDFFPVVDSMVTKKVTAAAVQDYVLGRSGSNDTIHISSSDALQISANTGINIVGNTTISGSLTVEGLGRSTITAVVAGMVADQTSVGSIANFGKSFALFSTTVNTHSRIRLYGSQSFRTNDLSRAIGTDPSENAGVIMDLVLSGSPSLFNYTMSPIVNGANVEPTPMSTIYYTVTNLSGVTSDISMSFNRLVLE